MPNPIAYMRDSSGKLVPPGQTCYQYVANFVNGESLPSWANVTAGTGGSVQHTTSGRGYYVVTSGAVIGDKATLAGLKIPTQQYKAIMVEWLGLQFHNTWLSTLPADVVLGIVNVSPDPSAGVRLRQLTTDTTSAVFGVAGVGTTYPVGYHLTPGGEASKWRNAGLLLYPGTKEVVFFENDPAEPFGHAIAPDMAQGYVRPFIEVTTREAVAKAFRIGGMRITLWSD